MNRIKMFSPHDTRGSAPLPKKPLWIETSPKVKLISGTGGKIGRVIELLIEFDTAFKRTNSDERSFDVLFGYVLQKHLNSNDANLIQSFVDTNLKISGKARKHFDLPPIVGGDEKPLKYIADQITSTVLFSEKGQCKRSPEVILNFLEFIHNAQVVERGEVFANDIVINALDPNKNIYSPEIPTSQSILQGWIGAMSPFVSRDTINSVIEQASDRHSENERSFAISTIWHLVRNGSNAIFLEEDNFLRFLENIESYSVKMEKDGSGGEEKLSSRIGQLTCIIQDALRTSPELSNSVKLQAYIAKLSEALKPELDKKDNWVTNLEFQEIIKMLTATGTAILAAVLV